MKGILAVLCVVGAAVAEPPAPYVPSGWRPNGPAFDLPQKGQNPNYLPPVDPRTPALVPDADVDVTVQGLPPRQDQQPIFQPSPISGQQYVGANFNADIRSLDQGLNQAQFQVQQQKAREFARQKQENEATLPSTNTPNRFNPRTTANPTQSTFTPRPDFRTTSTTPADLDLNEGETDEIGSPAVSEKQRVSVEVSKQNIQEYPPELFLNPLAQLRLQPVQFGQSPILVPGQQSQKQVTGFDAQTHFAALPSIIAQQQLDQQRALLQQYPGNQAFVVSGQTSNSGFLIQSPQPLQPVGQLQPLVQPGSPIQGQNVVLQAQGVNQIQPNFEQSKESEDDDDEQRDDSQSQQPQAAQPQFGFQPQPQLIYQQQPQAVQPQGFQPQGLQPQGFQTQPQPQLLYQQQPQAVQPEAVQPQGFQPQGLQPQGFQPQPQPQLIYQQQPQAVQPQGFQPQPQGFQQPQLIYQQPEAFQPQAETVYQQNFQNQQVYQPQQPFQPQALQPQTFQPQADQPQTYQPQTSYQPQTYQPQFYPDQQIQGQLVAIPAQNLDQYYQQQFQQQQLQRQLQSQGQDALQSGFDVNQQGNSLDQNDKESDENDGATATAVATAFGTRTQPRVFSTYGAPVPRAQNAVTTDPTEEATTEEGPAIAEATAVARGGRRKNAKLRSRRIRPDSPIFTLDKSGRLVLVSEQEQSDPTMLNYAPSGWRPNGPAFDLPQKEQNPNYLPPVDPRTPALVPDADVDVTVQGLPPRQDQQPIFQPSPISGQQYVGANFNADIRSLDQGLNQAQFQVQQQKAREFARQKQENEATLPSTNTPNRFNPRTTANPTQSTFTPRPDFRTTSTTPADLDLNEGETDEIGSPAVSEKQRVSVEVSKQNIQEYPPELFLNPLAQLRLQPVQFGQSPILVPGQQSQKQVTGFDAQTHFAALPSIIAQQQLDQQRALLQQYPGNQAFVVSGQTSNSGFLIQSPQPLQPVGQLQPLVQPGSPIQGQNVVLQAQGVNQIQPNFEQSKESEDDDDEQRDDSQSQQPQAAQPQFGFQPQPQLIYQQQPQAVQPQGFQPQGLQPQGFQTQPQPQLLYQQQPQAVQPEAVQPQGFQPQGLQPQGFQPQPQPQLIYQQQPQAVQPQGFQPQPQGFQQPQLIYQQPEAFQPQAETVYQQNFQNQQVYQPQQPFQPQALQPQTFQPQADQPQTYQPQTSYQPQTYQPQFYPDQQIQGQLVAIPAQNLDQYYQQQFQQQQLQRQLQSQGQDALQSGFDVNQQGNSLDQNDKESDENDGATATAVATAFGTRTQPRVFSTYGAPVPRAQNAVTTDPTEEATTEEGPAIA